MTRPVAPVYLSHWRSGAEACGWFFSMHENQLGCTLHLSGVHVASLELPRLSKNLTMLIVRPLARSSNRSVGLNFSAPGMGWAQGAKTPSRRPGAMQHFEVLLLCDGMGWIEVGYRVDDLGWGGWGGVELDLIDEL